MDKTKLFFLCILSLFIFISEKDSFSQFRVLQEDITNQVLTEETIMIKIDDITIYKNFTDYELTEDAFQFVLKNTENPENGYSFNFKAVKPGEVTITLSGVNRKKGEEGIIWKYYKVKVFDETGLTKVNALEIFNNPQYFTDRLFLLEGTSRGWGKPVYASEVWGKLITRSDWVLEDNTGAIYITGIFKIENGTEVKVIGKIVLDENSDWSFFGNKVIMK